MTKTILCTVDVNSPYQQAVQWAVKMAQQLKTHLTILYTYRLTPLRTGEILLVKKSIEEDARKQFADIEKQYLIGKGITYNFCIEVGFVSDRIEDHARKNDLDFLIIDKNISTNGKENFEELIEHIQVPTLVIP